MAGKTQKAAAKADDEAAVLAEIAKMPAPYRAMGERVHAAILGSVPGLRPRIWYGMPGYAKGSGPVLCFLRHDAGYMTFGLTEKASHSVEAGATDQLMASAWLLTTLDDATETRITAIVRKAVN